MSGVGLLVLIEGIGGSGLSLGRVERDGAPLCAEEYLKNLAYKSPNQLKMHYD